VIDKVKAKIKGVKSIDGFAGLALFFASWLFFYDLLDGRYLLTERDLGPYFIPPRFFWVESIKGGEFPLWNPYQFSGHPFFANPQQAILYPLNSLFFVLPFDVAFNAIIILHFFLGGFFTYLFLKDLKINTTGSLISGLIFMLSGYLLSVHSLLSIFLSSIWTPLIMMFFRRALLDAGLKNEVWVAIFMTLSFLAGGIEIVYGNFFVLIFMMIFSFSEGYHCETESKQSQKRDGHVIPQRGIPCNDPVKNRGEEPFSGVPKCGEVWLRVRSLLTVSIIFLFLSAVQLIPFVELVHHSIRGKGISYYEATLWSFSPKDVLLFFLPDAYGYFLDMKKYWVNQCWFKTLYTGGLPFILSLIFFLTPRPTLSPSGERDRVKGFGKGRSLFLSLMLFSLFLSLGKYNPFYPYVFKYFPFFSGIRYPVKFLYIFILVVAISAGLGFQRLTEFSKETGGKRLKNILMISSLVSGLLLLFFILSHTSIEQFLRSRGVDFPDFNSLSVNLHHVKRFLFYLALFFLLLRVGYEVRWKGWVKVLLLIFLTADLFGNMGFYGKEKALDYFKKTKILETISADKEHFRIFSTEKTTSLDTPILVGDPSSLCYLKEKHLPSLNLLYSLYDIWGVDVIRLKRTDDLYKAFIRTPSISATHLVDLYNVKYVISAPPVEKDPRLELIYARLDGLPGKREELLKENTVKLYRNRNFLSRAWLVKDFQVLQAQAILGTLGTNGFHPGKSVLLEEEPTWLAESFPQSQGREERSCAENKVEFVSESNNGLRLRVQAVEKSLLVLSDTYFPGWKAFINGKETKIYRANYAFRAVPLKAGTHEVEFVYDPLWFRLGAGLTYWGIIACLVISLFPGKNIVRAK